jgi:large subunit ribosomal protein L2
MALKHYKPTTPGQRQLVLVDRSALYKGDPVKSLTSGKISSGGRNNNGRITVRFRGGGHKRALRLVDFKRGRHDQPARVERIEYDPNRTGFTASMWTSSPAMRCRQATCRSVPSSTMWK